MSITIKIREWWNIFEPLPIIPDQRMTKNWGLKKQSSDKVSVCENTIQLEGLKVSLDFIYGIIFICVADDEFC